MVNLKEQNIESKEYSHIQIGLAPKHKYPGPLNECIKTFDYLTKGLGVSPSKIVLSGDSAGGALALETLMRTYAPSILNDLDSPRENFDLPLPAAVLLSSPLVTAETNSESWRLFEKKDLVSMSLAKLIFKEYLGLPHVNIEDLPVMRLHHVKKDFDRFLPKHVMVFVGNKEVLRDDILDMVKSIKEDGKIDIVLHSEQYAHDWFMIHQIIKKKDQKMIAKYDELFVDFAVEAVQEARLLSKRSNSTASNTVINENIDVKTISAEGDVKRPNFVDIVEENIKPVITKIDKPFDLFEKMEFPKPAQYKPNTILSDYEIITDSPSSTGVTA